MILNVDEAFDVTMLSMIEAMASTICQRHKPKTRRWNQAQALMDRAHAINATYHGDMPDNFVHKAEKFYTMIEADINWLLKGYREK